jgi:hypothetical protein
MNGRNGMRSLTLLFALLLLAPAAIGQDGKKDGAKPAKKPDPTARFWEARRVMLTGQPKDAAELFRTIAADHPGADVADDCLYWMGRCYLRIEDREPDAVVAFKRIVDKLPTSPFVDDAARELMRLGDTTMVKVLVPRLGSEGAEAELAARGLAELGDRRGVDWLAKHKGESPAEPAAAETAEKKKDAAKADPVRSEVEELRAEVRRLRKELDESVALLETLLAEKAAEEKAKAGAVKKDDRSDTESEKKK